MNPKRDGSADAICVHRCDRSFYRCIRIARSADVIASAQCLCERYGGAGERETKSDDNVENKTA